MLDALIAVQGGSRPGAAFPAKAFHQLATVGKLLDATESLALRHAGRAAHVDRTTRKHLTKLTHQVFEFVGVIEGEVIEIHDAQARCITRLRDVADGWLEGEGLAPAAPLLEHAMRVLSRLMVEVPTLPKPALFPTPDGGVQAEWMVATWSLDAHFLPDSEEIAMSAVQAATTVEHDRTFSRTEVTTENVHALGAWVNDTIVDA